MFDPFFPLVLICGPLAFVALLWIEARRKTASLRPKLETAILALTATMGISVLLTGYMVERYGVGMTEDQFNRVVLLSFVVAGALVAVAYLIVALIRRHRTGRPIQ